MTTLIQLASYAALIWSVPLLLLSVYVLYLALRECHYRRKTRSALEAMRRAREDFERRFGADHRAPKKEADQ